MKKYTKKAKSLFLVAFFLFLLAPQLALAKGDAPMSFTGLLNAIFTPGDLEPHRVHFSGDPVLFWLLVLGNALIAVSYVLIPAGLIYFVRKRKGVVFSHLFWLYGAFIILCGGTHAMMILVFWYPVYWLEMIILWMTGVVSIATFFSMIKILPFAMMLKSPKELESELETRKSSEESLKENKKILMQQNTDLNAALREVNEKKLELEQVNKTMVQREIKMIELKKRIAELESKVR